MRRPSRNTDPLVGRTINDRFRVQELIARGGMGRVYRAEQTPLGRTVALKVLDPRYSGTKDPQFEKRFFLEASVASKLQHPNTVTVFDYGRTQDGIYFIAMEYVSGESLMAVLHREKQLAPMRVASIGTQIARSLREAHRLAVIHRDLKPANVLITRHGDEEGDYVKLLDFGLVKAVHDGAEEFTQGGLFMGSPRYMAPEQIRGGKVDARTDIYALGALLYHLLCGRPPFDEETSVQTLMSHLHKPVPPIEVTSSPARLNELVLGCLAKEQADRPAAMDEVIETLKRVSAELGQRVMHTGMFLAASGPMPAGSYMQFLGGQPANSVQGVTPPSGQIVLGGPPAAPQPPAPAPQRRPSQWARWNQRVHFAKGSLVLAVALAAGFLAARVAEVASFGSEMPTLINAAPQGATPQPVHVEQLPRAGTPAVEDNFALLEITSSPSGAEIEINGKPSGTTPAQLELFGNAARPGGQVHISLSRKGYRGSDIVRVIDDEKVTVHAILAAERKRPSED